MQNANNPKYDIIRGDDINAMADKVSERISEGWQPMGEIRPMPDGKGFYKEMVLFNPPDSTEQDLDDEKKEREFLEKLNALDQKLKDLLAINGISLYRTGQETFIHKDGRVIIGITPNAVLNALKDSEHCPIDLDEQFVIDEIARLMQ